MKTSVACLVAFTVGLFVVDTIQADENLVDRPPNVNGPAFKDQVYPDFPDFDTFIVAAIQVGSDVQVDSITTFYTNNNNSWPMGEFNLAVLNVFDGKLQSADDPTQGLIVKAFYAATENGIEVTLDTSDLSEPLVLKSDIEYWIGLTPVMSFGDFGSEFRLGSAVGPPSMARNPAGGFGVGTEWNDVAQLFGASEPFGAAIEVTGHTINHPAEIDAVAYSNLRGFFQSGDLAATFDSDDVYLQFIPGITLAPNEPPVWIEFDGTLPTDCPDSLSVKLEASSNTVNLNQTIEMFDWTTSLFEVVHQVEASGFNADTKFTVDVTGDVARFVQPESGNVRSRFGWKPFDVVFIDPWTVNIDQVSWVIGK